MGENIVYEGPSGADQHCKMANQIALAGTLASCCEALTYAKSVGLDPRTMMDTIRTGAAGSWQLSNSGYKMLDEDYAPGFFVEHYIKDLTLAAENWPIAGRISRFWTRSSRCIGSWRKTETAGLAHRP